MIQSIEQEVIRKITWRLIPLLFLCYIIAYIDRINVGFAGLQLKQVFGVDETTYKQIFGLGSGVFFIGYFIFEIPSNLILHRLGARVWIARIMVVWGLVSAAMMFVRTPAQFYFMRFLLGVAEAGFFPGIILYLTYWFRSQDRGRTVALFATAGTLAGFVNSPISGGLLRLDGWLGLGGWQWLFLLEGLPAVIVGFLVLWVLPNKPASARWLQDHEKSWLQQQLDKEQTSLPGGQKHNLRDAFLDSRVWLLCLIYLLFNIAGYGYEMWLPQIIKGFSSLTTTQIGWVNAIPYLVATVSMVLVGRSSDRRQERRWHIALSALAGATGFVLSAQSSNPVFSMLALTIAFAGLKCLLGPFWAMGSSWLTGAAAAGGIALINSVGNLGGFFGPVVVGYVQSAAGGFSNALIILGMSLLLLALLVFILPSQSKRVPEQS